MDTARSNVSEDTCRSKSSSCNGNKKLFHALWTTSEDQRLQQLVNIRGPKDWIWIASHMEGRSAKQCNKRWHYKLDPNMRHERKWTDEEDAIIIATQAIVGNRWAKIAKSLEGRSDLVVKNRFYALQRAEKKSIFGNDALIMTTLSAQPAITKNNILIPTATTTTIPVGSSSSNNNHDDSSSSSVSGMMRQPMNESQSIIIPLTTTNSSNDDDVAIANAHQQQQYSTLIPHPPHFLSQNNSADISSKCTTATSTAASTRSTSPVMFFQQMTSIPKNVFNVATKPPQRKQRAVPNIRINTDHNRLLYTNHYPNSSSNNCLPVTLPGNDHHRHRFANSNSHNNITNTTTVTPLPPSLPDMINIADYNFQSCQKPLTIVIPLSNSDNNNNSSSSGTSMSTAPSSSSSSSSAAGGGSMNTASSQFLSSISNADGGSSIIAFLPLYNSNSNSNSCNTSNNNSNVSTRNNTPQHIFNHSSNSRRSSFNDHHHHNNIISMNNNNMSENELYNNNNSNNNNSGSDNTDTDNNSAADDDDDDDRLMELVVQVLSPPSAHCSADNIIHCSTEACILDAVAALDCSTHDDNDNGYHLDHTHGNNCFNDRTASNTISSPPLRITNADMICGTTSLPPQTTSTTTSTKDYVLFPSYGLVNADNVSAKAETFYSSSGGGGGSIIMNNNNCHDYNDRIGNFHDNNIPSSSSSFCNSSINHNQNRDAFIYYNSFKYHQPHPNNNHYNLYPYNNYDHLYKIDHQHQQPSPLLLEQQQQHQSNHFYPTQQQSQPVSSSGSLRSSPYFSSNNNNINNNNIIMNNSTAVAAPGNNNTHHNMNEYIMHSSSSS